MKLGLKDARLGRTTGSRKRWNLTKRQDVSFYDAAYHALALIHDGLFVTADTGARRS